MFCRNYCWRGHGGTLIYRSLRLKRRCFPAIAQALFVEFSAVSAGLFYIRQTDGKSADKQYRQCFYVGRQTEKAPINSGLNFFFYISRYAKTSSGLLTCTTSVLSMARKASASV